ncbi:MAG: hypothetical protein LW884_06990 [Bacteroidetes bacterium]|jgi:hypothetical protein|nr:hypothetical protein [Bacteroidota bacterium]
MNPQTEAYPELSQAQASALAEAKKVYAELEKTQRSFSQSAAQTTRGIAGLGAALQATRVEAGLKNLGRTARLEAEMTGKSLIRQADTLVAYYQGIGASVGGILSATTARDQARLGRQMEQQQEQVEATLAQIALLQEAEASASGMRQENLQQEISLKEAQLQQEQAAVQRTEQAQRQVEAAAARRTKQLNLFSATVDTAAAIAKAVASAPFPANIPAIAFASATGGAQIAAIAAQPLPQFRTGGLVEASQLAGVLRGPAHSAGGIPIEAEGGEYLVRKERVAAHLPLLEAINDGRALSPHVPGHEYTDSGARISKTFSAEIQGLKKELGKLRQVQVNLDARGFRLYEQSQVQRTEYLNQRYKS